MPQELDLGAVDDDDNDGEGGIISPKNVTWGGDGNPTESERKVIAKHPPCKMHMTLEEPSWYDGAEGDIEDALADADVDADEIVEELEDGE